jgi:hemerythrin-like domain-containing protein
MAHQLLEPRGVVMPVSPEQAEFDTLQEHARLRARLDQLVAEALPSASKVGHAALRQVVDELRSAIEEHLSLDERELVPLLQDSDAWGPVRVEELRERHAYILRALDAFADDIAQGKHGCDLLEKLAAVVTPLLRDMADEESAMLAYDESSAPIADQTSG